MYPRICDKLDELPSVSYGPGDPVILGGTCYFTRLSNCPPFGTLQALNPQPDLRSPIKDTGRVLVFARSELYLSFNEKVAKAFLGCHHSYRLGLRSRIALNLNAGMLHAGLLTVAFLMAPTWRLKMNMIRFWVLGLGL